MIDYSKYKRFYSTGGEFYLSGTDFTGYVEVINGVPCEASTRKILTPIQTFATDTRLSKYFYDRGVDDDVALPYSREDVIFNNNDFLTYDILKDKLKKLHENNIYIYSRLFLSNNNIPFTDNVSFLALKTSNDTSLSLLTSFDGNVTFNASGDFSVLGDVKDFSIKRNLDFADSYALFGITDTKFITLTSNRFNTSIIEISDRVESVENELKFSSLQSIGVNDTYAYISDFDNNVVYKYEVAGYFNGDYALANKRNFIEVIGGSGTVTDPSRFKGPKQLACSNSYVIVHDSGNFICKVYDTNFNFIQQIRGIPLKVETLVAMEFNELTNNLYIITTSNTQRIKLYVYDSDFVLRDEYLLDEELESGESITSISFSHNDSNIWFLCTNKYVYKKFINRPEVRIGRFQTENLFSNNINTYIFPQKEWDNYDVSTTTTISALSTVSRVTSVSGLSTSSIITMLSSLSTYTYTTTITSLSTSTYTDTVSSLSAITFFTTITSISARTVTEPISVLSAETFQEVITAYNTIDIVSPVITYEAFTNTMVITSLSANTITVPISTVVAGTPTSVVITALSTIVIPVTSVSITEVPNLDYYNVSEKIPINNFWNNTFINFSKAQFYWNVINTTTKIFTVAVRKPYQFYRVVMFRDSRLTTVQGNSSVPGSSVTTKPVGLYNIQLDVAWQPKYNTFTGWSWAPVYTNQPLGATVPTFPKNANSFIKGTNILTYTVRGDFYKEQQNGIYLYPPTQVFTNNTPSTSPYAPNYSSNAWIPSISGSSATVNNTYIEIDLTIPVSLSGIRVLAKSPPGNSNPRTPPFIKIYGSNNGSTFYGIGSAALPSVVNTTGQYIDVDLYEEAEVETFSTSLETATALVSSLSTTVYDTIVAGTSTLTYFTAVTALSTNTYYNATTSYTTSSLTTVVTALSVDTEDVVLYYTIETLLTSYTYDTALDSLSVVNYDTITNEITSVVDTTINNYVTGFSFTLSSQALSTVYYQDKIETYDMLIGKRVASFAGPVDDVFKGCRVVGAQGNYDDIVVLSNGRIYFIAEPSSYASVLKMPNFKNSGGSAFSLARDEYIQASTLNKELYKVINDIFILKNNIVGRFDGFYDKDVFTLTPKGYNYNINFLEITDQRFVENYLTTPEFEKYFINENEKNIIGVLNRSIENVYKLQQDLFNITKVDRGTELIPAFNNIDTVILD